MVCPKQAGLKVVDPVHQQETPWWETKAYKAFYFKLPEIFVSRQKGEEEAGHIENSHLLYLAMAPLPICVSGSISNSWSLSFVMNCKH